MKEKETRSVLIIESSVTLRHVLKRQLEPLGWRVSLAPNLEAGRRLLTDNSREHRIDALILGLSVESARREREFLRLVEGPVHCELAVLLLAHGPDSDILEWTTNRPRSALLAWDAHNEIAAALEKLLDPMPPATESASGAGDIRVLLVDDSRTVRATYRRLLAGKGYGVDTAADADEAFTKARASCFDIAIVDYFMPGGNGDQLCRRLREEASTAHMTVAILTGTYSDEVIQDSLNAGAIECMFKNEPRELFLARVEAMARAIRNTKSIDAERERLASILSSVGDGVYGVDTTGRITFMNPAARDILGVDLGASLVGQSAHIAFHHSHEDGRPNPPATCFLQQTYAGGGELRAWQTVFWRQDGHTVPVECTVFPLRLNGRLDGSVVAFRDVTERLLLERELLWQANHDPLTKLCNRGHFEQELAAEVNRLNRSRETSALLYLDLDRFKYINDTAGHAAGDQLLIETASQLRSRLRDADLLARLGGDEFAIILRNVTSGTVMEVAESFREILDSHCFVYQDKRYKVNGSIGVALITQAAVSPGEVLANADIACHIAKARGRNLTHLYSPENDEKVLMHHELGWSARLQEALKGDGFALYYQQIVPVIADGMAALHYEVLLRYLGSRGEVVAPSAFLPTAERFGMMQQLDIWVLTNAVRQLAAHHAHGRPVTFTVNISGQTLDAHNLATQLRQLLAEHRFNPQSLILEITETSAIANMEAAQKLIHEIKALGCRFALDDFGSGFSSFYHLKHLPVDFVKIDGQFVQSLAGSATDRAIVSSINDIAHSFGKHTVAEFVESARILEVLRECGVDYAQGYHISQPCAELPDLVIPQVGHA